MLAAFFDIKPAKDGGGIRIKDAAPAPAAKASRTTTKKGKAKKPKNEKVQPYNGGGGGCVHAQFVPTAEGPEPQGMMDSRVLECDTVGDASDPYEYLWQEADQPAVTEEDDTDSCVTFDDDVSDMSEVMGTSPVDATLDTLSTLFTRRKTKVSETPVYSGPQLWYEDDDFID